MGVIHLRDSKIPRQPIHFESRVQNLQLTDAAKKVTCKRCLVMMRRDEKWKGEK